MFSIAVVLHHNICQTFCTSWTPPLKKRSVNSKPISQESDTIEDGFMTRLSSENLFQLPLKIKFCRKDAYRAFERTSKGTVRMLRHLHTNTYTLYMYNSISIYIYKQDAHKQSHAINAALGEELLPALLIKG